MLMNLKLTKEQEEYDAWLKSLKPGDKAMLRSWGDGIVVATVESVTKSGRIRTGNREFNPDGRQRGGSGYSRARLQPVTPEIWELFRKSKIIEGFQKLKVEHIPAELIDDLELLLQRLCAHEPKQR